MADRIINGVQTGTLFITQRLRWVFLTVLLVVLLKAFVFKFQDTNGIHQPVSPGGARSEIHR